MKKPPPPTLELEKLYARLLAGERLTLAEVARLLQLQAQRTER